ncbi:MAG TPA: 4'-phosphopantetheinyl transferase superfamily protein [Kofleriaceae bacterium]|nr:4'-phosphopantetheinyl transferase superfamily protein [Kofleriaceae bacterium]
MKPTLVARARDLDVWQFTFAEPPGELARVLSADEHATAARFASDAHRDAYIVQHATVRVLAARYLGIDAARVAFERGRHGKPRLRDAADLELNLSHCDDVALVAFARGIAVGVDVERVAADLDVRALGRLVLAPSETAIAADRRGFLRVWCRKEACLKATGVGLLDDLTSVSVASDRVDVAGDVVNVQDLAVGTAHAAALATSRPVVLELAPTS